MNVDEHVTQAEFAELVGTSQPTVSRMLRDGVLPKGGSLRQWIQGYILALEGERDALAGTTDDSAEARAARLALTTATTKLREQQTRMLVREYEADCKRFTDHMLGEVQAVLYRQIPNAVVGRLLSVIQKQEDRYAACDVFRAVIEEAVARVMEAQADEQGFLSDDVGAPT